MKTPLITLIIGAFLLNSFGPLPAKANDLVLPAPGVMVHLSPEFNPAVLKGVTVHPDNPFKFDFILDRGEGGLSNDNLKDESKKLVKYFLSAITTPEKDLWVNLSPYEKQRIIPDSFGQTDMGRDLLAQDYMLKQITASLIYPEDELGKQFWKRVYEEATKKFGNTNIPVNTFNKVWIVPAHAKVYEHGNTAFIVKANLKVMLEEDYLALGKDTRTNTTQKQPSNEVNALGSRIVREIVIPQLEKEVNEGKNFSKLRQVYNSLILAVWFKKRMKDSILGRKYMDQNKVAGIDIDDKDSKQKIYERYLQAFKKGVYNYIKEETDPITQEITPRKYFSGGFAGQNVTPHVDFAQTIQIDEANITNPLELKVVLSSQSKDFAMVQDSKIPSHSVFLDSSLETGENLSEQQRFVNLQRAYIVNRIIGNRIYSSDHPASKYLTEILKGLTRKRDAQVFIYESDDINGFATPSGQIFVSAKTVKRLLKTREAAEAFLMHELFHIEEQHGLQRYETNPDELANLNLTRIFEMEADISMMMELDRRGINPIGALQLTESMKELIEEADQKIKKPNMAAWDENKRFWWDIHQRTRNIDVTHGSAQQRGMNLRELVRFVDLKNLRDERHSIDWQALSIDQRVSQQSQEIDSNPQNLQEFLGVVRQRITDKKDWTDVLISFCKLKGLALNSNEQDALKAVILHLIYDEGASLSGNWDILQIDHILEKDVLGQIGLPLSPLHLIKLMEISAHQVFNKSQQDIKQLGLLKQLQKRVIQYHQERYPNAFDFQRNIESALVGIYLAETAVQGLADFNIISAKDSVRSTVDFKGPIPFKIEKKQVLVDMLKEFHITNVDGIIIMEHVFRQLGALDVFGYWSGNYNYSIEHKGIVINFKNELLGALNIINSTKNDLWGGKVRSFTLAKMMEGNSIISKSHLYISMEAGGDLKEVNPDFNVGDYVDFDGSGFIAEIFDNLMDKRYERMIQDGSGKMASEMREQIVEVMKSNITSEDKIKLRNIMEYLNLSIRDKHMKTNPSGEWDRGFVPSFGGLQKLIITDLYATRSKKEFLDKVNTYIEDLYKPLSIDQSREFIKWLEDIVNERDVLVGENKFGFEKRDINELPGLLINIKREFLKKSRSLPANKVFASALDLVSTFTMRLSSLPREEYDAAWANISGTVNYYIQSKPDFPSTSQDFEKILVLMLFSQGNMSVTTVISTSFKEMIRRSKDFEEAFAYMKKYDFLPRNLVLEALDELLKTHAKKKEDLERLNDWFNGEVQYFVKSGKKLLSLEALQGIFRFVSAEDRIRFFKEATATANSDENFKKFIAQRWWQAFKSGEVMGFTNLNDIMFNAFYGEQRNDSIQLSQAAFDAVKEAPQLGGIDSAYFQDIYPTLFRLDSVTIYLLLRAMALEGEDAVFRNQAAKEELVNHVIAHYIRMTPTQNSERIIADLRSVIAKDLSPEDLFYFLGPSLTSMCLQLPEHEYPIENIVELVYQQFLSDADPQLKQRYSAFFANPKAHPEMDKIMRMRIKSYVTGAMPQLERKEVNRLVVTEPKEVAYATAENAFLERLSPYVSPRKVFSKTVTPIELSVEVSKQVGGLAVRLLQLVAMYFKLSVEDRETIAQVFDAVEGQNKLQFINHLKRAAEDNPRFKELYDGITEIGKMLGGASIVTFYSVTDKQGEQWAVGANNPNVAFRAGELKKFSDNLLDGMIARDPGNQQYRTLKRLMGDAYQWLLDEIDDPTYHEKNKEFVEQNDHRSTSSDHFLALAGSTHQLMVPEVVDSGVPDIRWDEQINGVSLNKILVDYQKAVRDKNKGEIKRLEPLVRSSISLIAQNYIYQLDHTLAHSDVHPGQFIVRDKEHDIAYLDRKNLLSFDENDLRVLRQFLKQLIVNFKTDEAQPNEIVNLIKKFFGDKKQEEGSLDNLKDDLLEKAKGKSPEEILQGVLWEVQKQGIQVPLKWVLVIKNFLALNRMSQEAGFKGLPEALLYDPQDPDAVVDASRVLQVARRLAPRMSKEFIKDEVMDQLKGKKIAAIFKNQTIISTVREKAKSWLDKIRRSRPKKSVPADVQARVDTWFKAVEENTRISISEEATQLGVTVQDLKDLLGQSVVEVEGNPNVMVKQKSGLVGGDDGALGFADHAMMNEMNKGGIDLTDNRMNLEVEKDKAQVSQTMDLKALENIEINELYIKDIEIKPLINLPQVLGITQNQ